MNTKEEQFENHIQQLSELRKSIDNCDQALIHILAERFKITQKIGKLKAKYKLDNFDPKRQKKQTQTLREVAEKSDLDPDFAENFLNFISEKVIQNHEKIKQSKI